MNIDNNTAQNHFSAHNILLPDGSQTLPSAGWTMDQSTVLRSVRKMLKVIYPEGLKGKTVIDVGCLEGGYATEFARIGMSATGLEVRDSNYQNCLYVKSRMNLDNLNFIHDDANNIDKYGNYDVFFINGLLYHLDNPRKFLEKIGRHCNKAIFIQTHVANAKNSEAIALHSLSELSEHEGLRGRWYPEHEDIDQNELEKMKWHSWSNNRSFWIQKEYLIDLLRQIGFDIVVEQFDFMDDIVGEMTGGFYKTNDRVMLVGIKSGEPTPVPLKGPRNWYPFPVSDAPTGKAVVINTGDQNTLAEIVQPIDKQTTLQIEALQREVSELHAALAAIRASTSWRMTEPLRKVARLARR
jgi:2-polyprenyl-3-methyl-5-hydroxy-6-metoxy-1,4-benzoquinol methylase